MLDISAERCLDVSPRDSVELRSKRMTRVATFYDWPSSAKSVVRPLQLAAAGFWYTGEVDRVQCAFCRGCLRNWKPGAIPAEEHRRHFPDCPFVCSVEPAADAAALSRPSARSKGKCACVLLI